MPAGGGRLPRADAKEPATMTVEALDHLNLSVDDFDATVAWYGRVFGFELVEEAVTDGVRWGVIRAGSALLCIYEHPGRRCLDRFGLAERGLHGLAHFGLRITDADAWLATVEREGVEILYGGEIHWPHSRAWYLKDPTGYEIEVACWDGGRIAFDPR